MWQGPVPPPLVQWAIDRLRASARANWGDTWSISYDGRTIIARKDRHTWTWRDGKLLTGLCIPGITLYEPVQGSTAGALPDDVSPPVESTAAFSDTSTTIDGMMWIFIIVAIAFLTVRDLQHYKKTGQGWPKLFES